MSRRGQFQSDRYSLGQLQYQDSFLKNTLDVSARLFAGEEIYQSTLYYCPVPLFSGINNAWHGGIFGTEIPR